MKYLIGVLPLFFVSNLLATNLCDLSCDLSITFPDGGSIKVDDDIAITFGVGAYINNGISTITFSVGEELELDDDSFYFQNGGVLEVGHGGNIKYDKIEITSNGVIELAAIDERELIIIDELKLKDDVTLNISSDLEVLKGGELQVKDGLVVAKSALTFINYGEVKGWFHFNDAVINYLKDKNSYKKSSTIEKILEKLRGGTDKIKEIKESNEISGIVYLDTDRSFILTTKGVVDEYVDVPEENSDANEVDDTNEIEITGNTEAIDVVVIVDDSTPLNKPGQIDEPLDNAVSVASAGAWMNPFSLLIISVLMVMLRLKSDAGKKAFR